jgi:hypothetical protein
MTENEVSSHGLCMGGGDSGPRGWLMLSDDVRSKVTSAAVYVRDVRTVVVLVAV